MGYLLISFQMIFIVLADCLLLIIICIFFQMTQSCSCWLPAAALWFGPTWKCGCTTSCPCQAFSRSRPLTWTYATATSFSRTRHGRKSFAPLTMGQIWLRWVFLLTGGWFCSTYNRTNLTGGWFCSTYSWTSLTEVGVFADRWVISLHLQSDRWVISLHLHWDKSDWGGCFCSIYNGANLRWVFLLHLQWDKSDWGGCFCSTYNGTNLTEVWVERCLLARNCEAWQWQPLQADNQWDRWGLVCCEWLRIVCTAFHIHSMPRVAQWREGVEGVWGGWVGYLPLCQYHLPSCLLYIAFSPCPSLKWQLWLCTMAAIRCRLARMPTKIVQKHCQYSHQKCQFIGGSAFGLAWS